VLVGEQPADVVVRAPRFAHLAAVVKCDHLKRAQPFAQRVGGDQRFDRDQHGVVIAAREPRFDAFLLRGDVQLVEAHDLTGGEPLVAKLGQRVAAPDAERGVESLDRFRVLPGAQAFPALGREALESERVDRVAIHAQPVSRCFGHEDRRGLTRPAIGLENTTEVRHVRLERTRRRIGRTVAPQQFDQALLGDDLADVQHEDRQHRALPVRPEVERAPGVDDPERPENADLHRLNITTNSASATRLLGSACAPPAIARAASHHCAFSPGYPPTQRSTSWTPSTRPRSRRRARTRCSSIRSAPTPAARPCR
jgi:hypothetical protein